MIAWLNPLALAGLAAVLGPMLVHLLRQPRAVRVPFPSLRFVQPSRTVAARMRRIADPWLLLVRVLIVAGAALALAQPVLLTPGRLDAWNGRTARAIVLDTSRSMQPAVGDSRGFRLQADGYAQAAVNTEAETAFASAVFEGEDLRPAIARAVAWLRTAPPARREVVIISDFQHGALPADVQALVPQTFGVRGVQVGEPRDAPDVAGVTRFGSSLRQRVTLADESTAVSWEEAEAGTAGVRVLPAEVAGTDRLVRAVAAAGAPAGDASQPLALAFATSEVAGVARVARGWMLDTIVRMSLDADLLDVAAASSAGIPVGDGDAWFVVARTADGRPVVRAAAAGDELMVQVAAAATDFLAAAALRSALHARRGSIPVAFAEDEIIRMTPAAVDALNRAPGEVGHDVAPLLARSDARWLWLTVLLLLGIETVMRRPRAAPAAEVARAI
jgi:hypothetical protein